ncbi:oxygenase MpaB family protein [Paraconexibacter sp.]|uniref:oxygenase MpaB family protein n=1 Tax=Paraconexibacter sp. TaxID=2949640 RepID=UPI003565332B
MLGLEDRLLAGRSLGDPLADAVVQEFRDLPGGSGWTILDAALQPGAELPEIPPALHDLLTPILEPPAWLDVSLADAGALAFWKGGAAPISLSLAAGSLAFGYQSGFLVRPLAATGRLERMASRRMGETARWVVDVTTPGGMHPGAAGVASSVRVRLVHALVRDHLLRSGDWDVEEWGVPISATDALVTAIGGFHVIPLRAMRDLGVRHTAAELEALTHLWRWTAFVMGVPEETLPESYAQSCELIDAALELDPGPTEDSEKLMHALLHHGVPLDRFLPTPANVPAEFLVTQVLGMFTRRWMGDAMADALGVPSSPLRHLTPALRPLQLARDVVKWTGVLGSEERLVAREIAGVKRTLRTGGAARTALHPQRVAREPVVRHAA